MLLVRRHREEMAVANVTKHIEALQAAGSVFQDSAGLILAH
jgi:hypothetical protein